MSVLREQFNY